MADEYEDFLVQDVGAPDPDAPPSLLERIERLERLVKWLFDTPNIQAGFTKPTAKDYMRLQEDYHVIAEAMRESTDD